MGIYWTRLDGEAAVVPLEIKADWLNQRRGIDWDRIEERAPTKFSPVQVAAAKMALSLMVGKKKDPNKLDTFWDMPKKMPTITDVDFRDMTTGSPPIDSLLASNKYLKRDRMMWHLDNPGEPMNPSVFTEKPIILQTKKGNIILDGQHRLAALKLLGATKWPVFLLPSRI